MPEPHTPQRGTRAERRAWLRAANSTAKSTAGEAPAERPAGRRRWVRITRWLGLAVLATAILVLSIPTIALIPGVSSVLPERTLVECRVGNPAVLKTYGRKRLNRTPLIQTDCGNLRSRQAATCTSDPGKKVQLISGTRYDIVVRGLDIPWFSSPAIVSAVISADQGPPPEPPFSELDALADSLFAELEQVDPEASAKLEAQQTERLARIEEQLAQFAPEVMRAFDYEQPAFDPLCDAGRSVMTTIGIQHTTPEQALEWLTVPEGDSARDELLPCDAPACSAR